MRSSGLPVTCSRAINFGCRTRELLAKGSSSILASRRILYQGFTSLDSGIHSLNFCTITNLVKLKLKVQFDICCRTGLILRSLTETKRNWTFAAFQRTNSRQSAVSLINSLMIWYSPIRAMKKALICTNSPRLTPPREHFKLHYYALCFAARLICSNGRRRQCII